MIFKKPIVQFVKIDLAISTYTQSQQCPEDELYIGGTPNYEICSGDLAPGNNCSKYQFTLMNN